MPFLVTTKRPCGAQFGRCKDPDHADVSRVAVATLGGREVWNAFYGINVPRREDVVDQIAALGDSGGTVGPLPDGTTIEVRDVQWRWLCDQTGERYPGSDEDRDKHPRRLQREGPVRWLISRRANGRSGRPRGSCAEMAGTEER